MRNFLAPFELFLSHPVYDEHKQTIQHWLDHSAETEIYVPDSMLRGERWDRREPASHAAPSIHVWRLQRRRFAFPLYLDSWPPHSPRMVVTDVAEDGLGRRVWGTTHTPYEDGHRC